MSNNNMSSALKRQRVEVQRSSGNHPSLRTEPHDPQEGSSRTRNNPPVHQVSFPPPPPGEETTYNIWRRRWMGLYGIRGISLELKSALQQYSQSVLDLQKKEQQETKAENEREEIYEERKTAEENVLDDEAEFKKAINDLREAMEAYASANENRDNMDQQTAERHIQNKQRRLQYAEEQMLEANEIVQRSQARLNDANEYLRSAEDSLDTARSRTLQCKDKVKQSRLAVEQTITSTGSGLTRRVAVIQPLKRIIPEPTAKPSTKNVKWKPAPPCCLDLNIVPEVCWLQYATTQRKEWTDLSYVEIFNKPNRDIDNEQDIGDFLHAEVEPRVERILKISSPNAKVVLENGRADLHADYFFRVEMPGRKGKRICSYVAVEAKSPFGSAALQPPLLERDVAKDNRWMVVCRVPSEEFGVRIAAQAYNYARNKSLMTPKKFKGKINPTYVFVTTFNQMWLIQIDDVKNGIGRKKEQVYISQVFDATSDNPHMAFAFAYYLDIIASDMEENPDNYPSADE